VASTFVQNINATNIGDKVRFCTKWIDQNSRDVLDELFCLELFRPHEVQKSYQPIMGVGGLMNIVVLQTSTPYYSIICHTTVRFLLEIALTKLTFESMTLSIIAVFFQANIRENLYSGLKGP
jgi:hypothetical protein